MFIDQRWISIEIHVVLWTGQVEEVFDFSNIFDGAMNVSMRSGEEFFQSIERITVSILRMGNFHEEWFETSPARK